MARNPEKNLELKEISMEKILQTGIILFAKKGFAGTKTTEIVKEAGISQGLLYHYFPVKENLYEECIKRCIYKSREYIEGHLDETKGAAKQIIQFTEALFEELGQKEVLYYQFILLIRLSLDNQHQEAVKAYENLPIHRFSQLIQEAQEEGNAVEGDPMVLAYLYFDLIKGVCMQLMDSKENIPHTSMIYHALLK